MCIRDSFSLPLQCGSMMEHRTSGHTAWDIKYHVILDHEAVVQGAVRQVVERARDPIRRICQAREVTMVWRAISQERIHMLVTAPPQFSPTVCRGSCGAL